MSASFLCAFSGNNYFCRMKIIIMTFLLLAAATQAKAQTDTLAQDSTVRLDEVVVRAAKVATRDDGITYIPSAGQKAASTDGYSLLARLQMPTIRVSETSHQVSAVDNKGVQIRLNGSIATRGDLMAMDPKLVRSVALINRPGVRYGADIGYVIDIRTRRADEGYSLGANLTNSLRSWAGQNMVYAKWNHRKSELSLSYTFGYNDTRGTRLSEQADYTLNDGAHYYITRADSARRSRDFGNLLQLKYSLADSASYVFQATLSTDFDHDPGSTRFRRFGESSQPASMTQLYSRSTSFSPVLDLYFFHTLGSHQSLTANVVGTSIATDETQRHDEGGRYAYDVDGNTWSITSEAVYENRLRPFTLSFGFNHQLKYTRNNYSGDVDSENKMHNSNLYLFSQLKGSAGSLGYTAGLGVNNARYSQGGHSYNYWLLRPRASLSYRLAKWLRASYDFQLSQHNSQIAMISDTRIRTNSMEWNVGNPDVEPNSVITHGLSLSCQTNRVFSQMYAEWRENRDCNMAHYERTADNQFLYSQRNQPHVNMLYISNYTSWSIVPDKLSSTLNCGFYRFFNRGDDYNHCLSSWLIGLGLQAYLGQWTLSAYADSGYKFMEGETWNHQEANSQLQCSYRMGALSLSLIYEHPLQAHPRTAHSQLTSSYIHKLTTLRNADYGNAIYLQLSYRLQRGRKYADHNRTMKNSDHQTGIM